jgi:DNA-binding response OmpR family regulator
MMPEMDGLEILRQLQGNPTWHKVPFVFLTARADGDSRQAGLALGACGYLTKPFNLSEVISMIHHCLDRT